jgi:hypothetical protein
MASIEKSTGGFGEVLWNITSIVLVLGAVALLGEGFEHLLEA